MASAPTTLDRLLVVVNATILEDLLTGVAAHPGIGQQFVVVLHTPGTPQ